MTRHTRCAKARCTLARCAQATSWIAAFGLISLAINFPAKAEPLESLPFGKHLIDNQYDDGAGSGREGLLSPDEPDEGDSDEDDKRDGLRRFEPEAPAGCMFRDGPLELMV